MKSSKSIQLSILFSVFLSCGQVFGQSQKELNISQAINLALENHQQLKVSSVSKEIAEQQTKVAKLQLLPNIAASATAGYIGDVLILDPDFKKVTTKDMPHFGNSYGVQASQLLYKGGLVKKSIEMMGIREQLAELDEVKDQQSIKFLVISNYLDLCKLLNQEKVYQNNRKLAEMRLENVRKYYKQGMITRNEVIRGELALQNMDQAILVVKNNIAILDYNLSMALGLPNDTTIIPTESIAEKLLEVDKNYYFDLAYQSHPQLNSMKKNVELADKNIQIINTDKYPSLSAIGGYNMQRPITNVNPVMDMYSNSWQVGLSLNYNIDNLYKTKEKLKLGNLQKAQILESTVLMKQNIEMGVNAAYIKYQESVQNANILMESRRLAQENYKIVEAKYLNQLAIQAEMTDATNAKLEAELQYANAEINVLYQYYNLIKTTGTL
ncbi:TolC family protein [Kaistella montana]|uniref:TolC family protein n=1 Tax=Kaistella montana TaxID=1849733 RepID=A0ABW5K8P7_9FLAO|nr:TolC family protein [Kaistella montana]MCQ4034835.1 TolC family protein [Kaistella montana]